MRPRHRERGRFARDARGFVHFPCPKNAVSSALSIQRPEYRKVRCERRRTLSRKGGSASQKRRRCYSFPIFPIFRPFLCRGHFTSRPRKPPERRIGSAVTFEGLPLTSGGSGAGPARKRNVPPTRPLAARE